MSNSVVSRLEFRLRARPSRWRRLPPKGWRWLTGAIVALLVLAGVEWAIWPSPPAPVALHLVAGTVQADLLTPGAVSALAGTTVVASLGTSQPPAPVSVTPVKCAVAAGPATQSVYGQSWSAFLAATDQEAGGRGDYTVSQVVGVFPDRGRASTAFATLVSGLAQCPSAVAEDRAGSAITWAYTAYPATAIAVAWTAAEEGGDGWACYHQAQLTGTALVQVAICAGGDGAPAASALAGALAAKVSR